MAIAARACESPWRRWLKPLVDKAGPISGGGVEALWDAMVMVFLDSYFVWYCVWLAKTVKITSLHDNLVPCVRARGY